MPFFFLAGNNSHLGLEGTIMLPLQRTSSMTDLTNSTGQITRSATIRTLSPANTFCSSIDGTLVSSGSGGGPRLDGRDIEFGSIDPWN